MVRILIDNMDPILLSISLISFLVIFVVDMDAKLISRKAHLVNDPRLSSLSATSKADPTLHVDPGSDLNYPSNNKNNNNKDWKINNENSRFSLSNNLLLQAAPASHVTNVDANWFMSTRQQSSQSATISSKSNQPATTSSTPRPAGTVSSTNTRVCQTPGCLAARDLIVKAINRSADPCTDFSMFSCGQWRANNAAPARDRTSLWEEMENQLNNITEAALLTDIRPDDPNLPLPFSQARQFFEQCAANYNKSAATEEVFTFLKSVADWPILSADSWRPDSFDLAEVLGKLWRTLGTQLLVGIGVDVNFKQPTQHMLYVQQGELAQMRHYYNRSLYPFMMMGYRYAMQQTFDTVLEAATTIKSGADDINIPRSTNSSASSEEDEGMEFQEFKPSNGKRLADAIAEFEADLANQVQDERDQLNPDAQYNVETLQSLRQKYACAAFSWDRFFEHALAPNENQFENNWFRFRTRNIAESGPDPEKQPVVVTHPQYLAYLMQRIDRTPKHVIANYLFWRLVLVFAQFMGNDYQTASAFSGNAKHARTGQAGFGLIDGLRKALKEQQQPAEHIIATDTRPTKPKIEDSGFDEEERENEANEEEQGEERRIRKQCLQTTTNHFQDIVDYVFVKRTWSSANLQNAITELTTDIRQQLIEALRENKWLTPFSKQRAITKANDMVLNIGYPARLMNLSRIRDRFKGLEFSPSKSNFQNFISVSRFSVGHRLKQLFEPTDRSEFPMALSVVNAEYVSHLNSINIPVAEVLSPNFDLEYPSALNYAMTGFTIAHEMFHGFDDYGILFDNAGTLQSGWLLDSESIVAFKSLSQCFTNQFSQKCFNLETDTDICRNCTTRDNLCINGTVTFGENLADSSGIKVAYRAFESHLDKTGERNLRLPGLEEYSAEQLFFISFGVGWCSDTSPENLKSLLLEDGHSPETVRIEFPTSNMPEFQRAFNCPQRKQEQRAYCEFW